MRFILYKATLTTIFLLLFSCSVNNKKSYINNVTLESGKWILINLNSQEVIKQNADRPIYLEFNVTDQKLTGFAGCNRLFGAFNSKGSAIAFSQIGSTKMICPDANIETDFISGLQQITRYQIDGEKLLLYNRTNLLLTLRLLTD
ncbi:META domain-containing protein [Adhaeribacter radiodurans]|uniref:META domain-containing protein n=1 Tax=Adhaeribacter radiodurans TaxID=2745197 RepID=A0A7L7L439_9BACT|nr:META domain-containing protein [Adhaeribacter radiodurans]QMU27355.1 META domain-containing protein [Adhaeribacter radiodurans]